MSKLFAVTLFILAIASPAFAQGHRGISSEGRDFYIGYMPNLPIPSPPEPITPELAYIIVCSEVDGNTFAISYFGDDGREVSGSSQALMKGRCAQIPLVKTYMQPKRPGETLEFKAAHVTSRYPVSVAVYQDGSAAGGMYQAIPTAGLGKSYVVAGFSDCPREAVPAESGFSDSSSSEFLIVATQDSTHVTWIPNATTRGGVTGRYSGLGSTSAPHAQHLTMRRGQVYWVRSNPTDLNNDLTGSSIVSDKVVAVLGGQEKALLGDPGRTSDWADVRDLLVEEMTPVDSWDSEYVSIPFLPAQSSNVGVNGWGDLYRIITDSANAGSVDAYPVTPSTKSVVAYQAADYQRIEDPVDILYATRDDNGRRKKMYALQYDYYQGDESSNQTAYTTPNETNLIGFSRMPMSTVFHVPLNSKYQGAQFINVITRRDSLTAGKITLLIDGKSPFSLYSYPRMKTYSIPNHPELMGFTSRVGGGKDYMIYGNTPLACYSYGRTENTQLVSPWGYAAPTGMMYGSHNESTPPRADVVPSCDHWNVRVFEDRKNDEGIAGIMLLNDPTGQFAKPAHVSANVSLFPSDPKFTPGDTSVSFQVLINDSRKDAYAALYVLDRAGNDTVINLNYKAPKLALGNPTDSSLNFKNANVGVPACSTVTVHILETGVTDSATFTLSNFVTLDTAHPFSVTSSVPSGTMMHKGSTVDLNICFTPTDTLKHAFTFLPFSVGCYYDTVLVRGNGVTPIIIASDWDFGNVPVGTTSATHSIQIQNVGNGDLILDKNWTGLSNPDFSFVDADKLPDTIKPHDNHKLNFSFHPTQKGPSDARIDWGTNLNGMFAHEIKDTSHLAGYGIEASVEWDRRVARFGTWDGQTQRINLINLGAEAATIVNVQIIGPDTSEFHIIGNEMGFSFPSAPFALDKNDSIWFDIGFNPDSSRNGVRVDWLVADSRDDAGIRHRDTVVLIGQLGSLAGVSTAAPASSGLTFKPAHSNPNLLEISLPAEFQRMSDLYLFDALGRMIKEIRTTGESMTLDISTLPSGTYYVRVTNGAASQGAKFVVIH
jgi:hypothetical protein